MNKHRPTLTREQIVRIIELARTPTISDLDLQLISSLVPYLSKIDNATVVPAYNTTSRASVLEQLGGPISQISHVTQESKEEYWSTCYTKYAAHPEVCTVLEIQAAKEHMYLHNLMNEQEVAEFEQQADQVLDQAVDYRQEI